MSDVLTQAEMDAIMEGLSGEKPKPSGTESRADVEKRVAEGKKKLIAKPKAEKETPDNLPEDSNPKKNKLTSAEKKELRKTVPAEVAADSQKFVGDVKTKVSKAIAGKDSGWGKDVTSAVLKSAQVQPKEAPTIVKQGWGKDVTSAVLKAAQGAPKTAEPIVEQAVHGKANAGAWGSEMSDAMRNATKAKQGPASTGSNWFDEIIGAQRTAQGQPHVPFGEAPKPGSFEHIFGGLSPEAQAIVKEGAVKNPQAPWLNWKKGVAILGAGTVAALTTAWLVKRGDQIKKTNPDLFEKVMTPVLEKLPTSIKADPSSFLTHVNSIMIDLDGQIKKYKAESDTAIKEYKDSADTIIHSGLIGKLMAGAMGAPDKNEIEALMMQASQTMPEQAYQASMGSILKGYYVAKKAGIPVNAMRPEALIGFEEIGKQVGSGSEGIDKMITMMFENAANKFKADAMPKLKMLEEATDARNKAKHLETQILGTLQNTQLHGALNILGIQHANMTKENVANIKLNASGATVGELSGKKAPELIGG